MSSRSLRRSRPKVLSLRSRFRNVEALATSLTATTSRSSVCAARRRKERPTRPIPLMPTRMLMRCLPLLASSSARSSKIERRADCGEPRGSGPCCAAGRGGPRHRDGRSGGIACGRRARTSRSLSRARGEEHRRGVAVLDVEVGEHVREGGLPGGEERLDHLPCLGLPLRGVGPQLDEVEIGIREAPGGDRVHRAGPGAGLGEGHPKSSRALVRSLTPTTTRPPWRAFSPRVGDHGDRSNCPRGDRQGGGAEEHSVDAVLGLTTDDQQLGILCARNQPGCTDSRGPTGSPRGRWGRPCGRSRWAFSRIETAASRSSGRRPRPGPTTREGRGA